MGHILHPSATTTTTVRRALQNSQESIRTLARRYNLNPKTVAKWKKRRRLRTHRWDRNSVIRPFSARLKKRSSWPFASRPCCLWMTWLYALQASIPHLTRSSLHRCLQRHGLSRLPDVSGTPRKKARFKTYPIGYFHVDIAEVQTEEGKLHLFVAIDRTSKYVYVEVHAQATRLIAVEFLRHLIEHVPYRIHTLLTDNGIQFANQERHKWVFKLLFDRVCDQHQIEHRLTKLKHPWTNGQVERMNRTLKEATVHRYHYDTHQTFQEHLATFVMAYNLAKRLKTRDLRLMSLFVSNGSKTLSDSPVSRTISLWD